MRRALEEADPEVETFSSAGYFGVAVDYKGIDDPHGAAFCSGSGEAPARRPGTAQGRRQRIAGEPPLAQADSGTADAEFVRVVEDADARLALDHRARIALGGSPDRPSAGAPALCPAARLAEQGVSARAAHRTHADAEHGAIARRRDRSVDGIRGRGKDRTSGQRPGPGGPDARFRPPRGDPRARIDQSEQSARIGARLRRLRGTARRPQRAALCRHGEPAGSARAVCASEASTFPTTPGSSAAITTPAATTWNSSISMRFRPRIRPIWSAFASRSTRPGRAMPTSARGDSNRVPADASPDAALRHVEERSEHLAEPRPEYGHCTNAVCIVGRRSLTRGLFLDRRAFLVSYDADQDPGDQSLAALLAAVVPVCAGISLEYYFSFVDNDRYGCGTKLPHNVTGPGGRDGRPRQRPANRIALADGRDPRARAHALRDRDHAGTPDEGGQRQRFA